MQRMRGGSEFHSLVAVKLRDLVRTSGRANYHSQRCSRDFPAQSALSANWLCQKSRLDFHRTVCPSTAHHRWHPLQ